MLIMGVNTYHGDASAALVRDGELVGAVEEERFRRIKHWAGLPSEAMASCLAMGGAKAEDIDYFAVSRNPRANLLRKVLFTLRHLPSPRLVIDRLQQSRRVKDIAGAIAEALHLDPERVRQRMHWIEHHPTHLASTFFVSPFDTAAVCAIDGFGDFVSTSWAIGEGTKLNVYKKVYFPHSLGLVYLAITQYLGFLNFGDEFKVMGLAPYGKPDYVEPLKRLLHLQPDGGFELDLSYFKHKSEGISMTWDNCEPTMGLVFTPKLEELLGPKRQPKEPLQPRHEALAASLQHVFEEAAFHILNSLWEKTRLPRLCIAGGCAMNSVMNGKIRERTPFKEVYVQPASGDNGTALGAAFQVWNQVLQQPRKYVMEHGYWGPTATAAQLEQALKQRNEDLEQQKCSIEKIDDEDRLCDRTTERIAQGNIIGWFQGRMEWGARALGNRSILADPRRADMRDIINAKIKFREKFRPFAPSILEEAVHEYFVGAVPDPFMVQVYPVQPDKRTVIPAVTHVDGSGRLQTVSRKTNPLYWKLISKFNERTGVPVLLNTSFNENEPIVHNPLEALDCFLRTSMDTLALGPYFINKPTA